MPRRTPNSHAGQLWELYGKLYPAGTHAIALDAAYRVRRADGVALCQVWLNRGACPHAVESTMALVEAQQLDELLFVLHPGSSLGTHSSHWSVRSTYAMALLRFVNSVADAMQTGLYAQSIFNIAERIGLPVWFVELRHAATHEEMPSLDALRQASVDVSVRICVWVRLMAAFIVFTVLRLLFSFAGARMAATQLLAAKFASLQSRTVERWTESRKRTEQARRGCCSADSRGYRRHVTHTSGQLSSLVKGGCPGCFAQGTEQGSDERCPIAHRLMCTSCRRRPVSSKGKPQERL